jgi:Flp pilus assembly protein CpaB
VLRRPFVWPDPVYRLGARLAGWPRRLIAIGCLVVAIYSYAGARSRPTKSTAADAPVVVAARDLAAGSPLLAADVHVMTWPRRLIPAAAVRSVAGALGRTTAGAIATGEPVTSTRLQGKALALALPTGQVAISVPLTDGSAAHLIQAGDHVDLLTVSGDPTAATPTVAADARVVAADVRVLAVFARKENSSDPDRLIIAADAATVRRVAGALSTPILATLRAPP